jgi:hypothetical protein
VYGVGVAPSGAGHLWEDGRGSANASYTLVGKSLTLRSGGGGGARHRFELQNVPPAASFKPSSPANASAFDTHRDSITDRFDCSAATVLEPQRSFYDGASLSFSLHMAVRGDDGCALVSFERPLSEPAVATALALPFQQARARLHVIKQQFDDKSSTPGTFLM